MGIHASSHTGQDRIAGVISSGSLKLDIALRTGGFPKGAIVEISGISLTGKTTLCQHITAEAQRLGGSGAWIDTDMSFSPEFARRCGVRLHDLYFCQPPSAEQALDILERLAKSGAFSTIVFDSLRSMVPEMEFSGAKPEAVETKRNELLSNSLSRIAAPVGRKETLVIFTDHPDAGRSSVYHRLGTQLGRLSIKLHASIRLQLEQIQAIKIDKNHVGEKIRVRVIKNIFKPCLYTTDFDIMYDQGINCSAEVFSLAASLHLIHQMDDGYQYQETFLGQTSQQAIRFLEENHSVRRRIDREIRQALIPQGFTAAR